MAHLVGKHRLELGVIHNVQQAGCRRHDSMSRITTRRKCIRSRVINDVDFRCRHTSSNSEVLNHSIETRIVTLFNLLRASHRNRQAASGKVLD
ncbi:hypothetical protein D3C86_1551010 [compost metagenome]